jgi:hypothetical protein
MKRVFFISALIIVSFILSSAVTNAAEKQITTGQMFVTDCTVCHSEANARKIHGNKVDMLRITTAMKHKEGSNITDQDAEKIAEFLADPNRSLFESKCTKCHTMERITKLHMKGVRAEEMQKVIDSMCAKEGADISPAEKKAISEHVGKYCTVK